MKTICLFVLSAWLPQVALSADDAAFHIERSTVLTSAGEYHWAQSRAALIPGDPARVIVTTQEIEKHGSHGYRDVFSTETADGARTWSAPKRIESLARSRSPRGIESVMGDICPQWHQATRTLLATGKAFGFRTDAKDTEAKDDRSFEKVAYAVWSPATQQWSGMKIVAIPPTDHAGNPIIEPNAGCNQRFDLPNGDVLLPVRYRKDAKSRVYTTIVARCSFDGETLTYREHGSEFSITKPRGLYEPSVCGFNGRYFLTMRAEETGYVARGTDGVNYEPIVEWTFDDGKPLGSYNTQQHWITHGNELYLIYTRRGADNDHVFRNRAPIFIARVDPERLCVLRATEQVLMPETGVDLGGGFAPLDVSASETWVISTEMAFPKNRADESNRVLLARIVWTQQNCAQAASLGFETLFDGKSFSGWEQKGNWVIEDGAFFRKDKGGPLTYTAKPAPDDFELRFEWKVSKGCNSGVYYRPGQVEYQVLDNVNSPYGENPRQAAASLFFCMAPSKDATRPLGEWNVGRVVCKSTVIQHWLNGEKVIDFDYTDPKWAKEVELLHIRGGNLAGRGGKLWLQDHGGDVWFRNIRLRAIPLEEKLERSEFTPMPVPPAALEKENERVRQMLKAKEKK